jgi:hypothetical protein
MILPQSLFLGRPGRLSQNQPGVFSIVPVEHEPSCRAVLDLAKMCPDAVHAARDAKVEYRARRLNVR